MPLVSCHFRGTGLSGCIRRVGKSVASVLLAAIATTSLVPPPQADAASGSVEGIWYDDTGKGAVEILRCGTGSKLCGRIVWLRKPTDRAGRPITDELNPSARRRNRPICGLQIMGGLRPQRDGSWDTGWIYDPKKGKSYDVMLRLKSPQALVVTGYLGVKFLSESYVWHRAPPNIQRCSAN